MTETQTATGTISNEQLTGLEYRHIGPHKGGRCVAVVGHPDEPMVFYFGACAGGVWKTRDGGTFWECISDGYFNTAAIGALAICEADPNVLYAGTGETTIRGNVSHGDGVYKTTDGGKTWKHVGLKETRHIAKVRVHPRNPDLVYVASLGHAWGPNEERGLFRSKDGGQSWEKILFRSDRAGAIDLSMDPHNPRILYCAFWEASRSPYSLTSGGPGSSIYASNDGGDTWTDITHNEGLPKGTLGKIGIAVSPARPDRVWALIEAEDGALFRSDNGGETWQRINETPDLRRRAWYYMHVFADPQDPDVVWVPNLRLWKSIDGGKNFASVPTPHGDDHDMWIDPKNPMRIIEGNDGGACVSYNGGESWSTILNQPTAQFYHVTTDTQVPYRVYGSQQDNTAISVPSLSMHGAITEVEWFVPGGGESGYIAVRPDNPDIQYAGDHHGRLTRHDRRTGQQRTITVWPDFTMMYEGAGEQKHRFQWTFPIFLSPHDPNVLYTAAERLFKSTDEGATWEPISPDLTHPEPHMLERSGGPITLDNTSAEFYGTIFAAVESPDARGTFWVGTDDGWVHLSRDNGKTWKNITPKDLPEWSLVSVIDLSPHDPGSAYLAATRYKLDDVKPYLYKTHDYGATWTKITNGIPDDDFTRVIREDPGCKGLLYAGTETGLYVSFDDGHNWEPLQANLPVCPIHDLVIKDTDLVVGTHGRGFWILDDITPLHEIAQDRRAGSRLFPPRDTIRFKIYEGYGFAGEGVEVAYRMAGPITYAFRQVEKTDGTKVITPLNAGQNRANGVLITYYLAEEPEGEIELAILDENGVEIRRFSSKKEQAAKPNGSADQTPSSTDSTTSEVAAAIEQEAVEGEQAAIDAQVDEEQQGPYIPKRTGLNRFTWNFRAANAIRIPGDKFADMTTAGPVVPPGRYQIQLTVNGETFTQPVQILPDPRVDVSAEHLEEQYALGLKIRDTLSQVHEAVIKIRDVREQIEGWEKRLARQDNSSEARAAATSLRERLGAIEEELVNTKGGHPFGYPPPNMPMRLNQKLTAIGGSVGGADAAPARQQTEVFEELSGRVNEQLTALNDVLSSEVEAFNRTIQELHVPAIALKG